jgi:NADPH:quinone reductase-like Zn-dependent oxidoreductase
MAARGWQHKQKRADDMKAARVHQYGRIEDVVLDDVSIPEVGLDEVLVQIEAASINPLDVKLISGSLHAYFPLTMPYSVGTDLSGTVVQSGRLAARFKKGDRVIGRLEPGPGNGPQYSRGGAFAQCAVVPARHLTSAPSTIELAESAGLPTAAGTAWQALFEGAYLKPGQTILVHAGAGGVGSFAVQLSKYIGARVIATASSANAQLVHTLGADQVVDYKSTDFSSVLDSIDVVFDTVGGETLSQSYRVLKPGGTLVTITGTPDQEQAKAHNISALRVAHESDAARLGLIVGLCDSGHLQVLVDRSFPLADARGALAYSASGRARGKILLRPNLL